MCLRYSGILNPPFLLLGPFLYFFFYFGLPGSAQGDLCSVLGSENWISETGPDLTGSYSEREKRPTEDKHVALSLYTQLMDWVYKDKASSFDTCVFTPALGATDAKISHLCCGSDRGELDGSICTHLVRLVGLCRHILMNIYLICLSCFCYAFVNAKFCLWALKFLEHGFWMCFISCLHSRVRRALSHLTCQLFSVCVPPRHTGRCFRD